MVATNRDLIAEIRTKSKGYLDGEERSRRVLEAMEVCDRKFFLPENETAFAYFDRPLSIGYGQTCSQPSMVAFMLDKLDIKPGNRILEIGSGCGYAASIAGQLCQPGGMIYAVEIIPQLAVMARMNCARFGEHIRVIEGDASTGLSQFAPFDRIFMSAGVASRDFDESILLKELAEGGIFLYPESRGSMYRISKTSTGIKRDRYYGVSFVPLCGENS